MKQHLVMFLAYVHRPTSSDLLFNYLENIRFSEQLQHIHHYSSQLVTADLVCLVLLAGQVVYSGFFARNSCLMHLETALLRVKRNTKGVDLKTQVVITYVVHIHSN